MHDVSPSLLRRCIRFADRPVLRRLLAWTATAYARRVTAKRMSIFYDGVWMHRLPSGVVIPTGPGFHYYRDDLEQLDDRATRMQKDSEDYWFFAYKPRPGDVVIDVGAEVGLDTLVFSRAVGPTGRVVAIEAHPTTFLMLRKLCEWNRLANTTCIPFAVSSESGSVVIEDGESRESNSIVRAAPGTRGVAVKSVTLDQLCGELGLGIVNYLKMNIEGAEQFAIRGMSEVVRRTQWITIACHDFREAEGGAAFSTRQQVVAFLAENGFDIVTRDNDPRPYVRDHIHGVRRLPLRA